MFIQNAPEPVRRAVGRLRKSVKAASFRANVYATGLYIRQSPIVVYSMGRVGSSSVAHSLQKQAANPVFHVHIIEPANLAEYRQTNPKDSFHNYLGRVLYDRFVKVKKPYKVITVIREPIARNISAFFFNLPLFTGLSYEAATQLSVPELTELFIEKYPHHTKPLEWYDTEFRPTLGLDVYAHPFPCDTGFLKIEQENITLLILKIEMDQAAMVTTLADFAGVEKLKLIPKQRAQSKVYGALYKTFMSEVVLPESYVNQLCDSPFTRHFYSDTEIARIRARWLRQQQGE